jgi:hypothetical protein
METTSGLIDYIEKILARDPDPNSLTCFRGHEDSAYILQPCVFRSTENRQNEHLLLRELIAAHPSDFSSDASTLELLVRMQHYSLPTRLLDASWNPLIGLYFACQPKKKRKVMLRAGRRVRKSVEAEGEVVILSVPRRKLRYFDSDTVSCLTNLARLKYSLKEKIDTSLPLPEFNRDLPVRRLLHFIRQERPSFEPEIKPGHLDSIFLVKPKQNNKRILAQDGAFFVFGLNDELTEDNTDEIEIERIKVPAGLKAQILGQLEQLGFNDKTVWPEMDRAAQYITKRLTADRAASKRSTA